MGAPPADQTTGGDDPELAEIAIARLGDAAQALTPARGVLIGDQADPGRERRALSNRAASPRVATMALDRIGQNCGIVASRQRSGLLMCHATIWRSRAAIWVPAVRHCSTSGIRIGG